MNAFFSRLFGIDISWDKIVFTLTIIGALIIIRAILVYLIHRRTSKPTIRYQQRKFVEYVVIMVGLIMIGQLWVENARALGNYLALSAAALTIALQDLIANLAGWIFIVWRRPFTMGDRIEVDGHAGDVVGEGYFMFSLLEIKNWVDADQSTGRILHIPNRVVFKKTVANFSSEFPFVWHETLIHLTFESNWERAKEMLEKIVHKQTRTIVGAAQREVHRSTQHLALKHGDLSSVVYTSIESSGVRLAIRYLTPVNKRRVIAQAVGEAVLRTFAGHNDIHFAYPTQRIVTTWQQNAKSQPNE